MRSMCNVLRGMAVFGLILSLIHATPNPATAQSSEITVLVAPLVLNGDVHKNFGKDVAKKVRERLESFGGLRPIEEGDIKDFLKQYGLKEDQMSPIEWRQLAGQMGASMVMIGTAAPGGEGIQVDVSFMDPKTGDQLPVQPFSVADRKQVDAAADAIAAGLESGVEYQRSIAFCSEYLGSEQIEDALRNCNKALELNPGSKRALYLRGRTRMAEEAWGAAAEDLEKVVEADPSNTDALQSLAYVHAQLGNKDRSLELYREYLNFNPDDAAVRLNIAYELANAGAFTEAMEILEDGVERDPENVDLLIYLGSVALSAGQTNGEVTDAEAIRTSVGAFEKVLEAKGDQIDPTILTNVINAHMLIGDYDAALAFSDRALEIINRPAPEGGEEPGTSEVSKEALLSQVYAARANVHSRMDRYADAAREFARALEYDPDIENGFQRLALFKLKAGDTDGAIADFRVAVERGADPDEIANALFGQGYNDYFQKGQYRDAIQLFNVAAEFARAPDVAQQVQFFTGYGYYQLGTALDNGNQETEACGPARAALDAFQKVLPHLSRAGSYQAGSQAQIRDAVDVQLYRQEQIIKKACSR